MRPDSEEYLQALDHSIKEIGRKGFQQEVTNGFLQHGHRCVYHTWNSKNSPKGFPDTIVPVHPANYYLNGLPPLLVIELKAGDNNPSDEQIEWLQHFWRCGAKTFCLWPRHRPVLQRLYVGDLHSPLVQNRLHVYTKR